MAPKSPWKMPSVTIVTDEKVAAAATTHALSQRQFSVHSGLNSDTTTAVKPIHPIADRLLLYHLCRSFRWSLLSFCIFASILPLEGSLYDILRNKGRLDTLTTVAYALDIASWPIALL